jgi:hypothetical protein
VTAHYAFFPESACPARTGGEGSVCMPREERCFRAVSGDDGSAAGVLLVTQGTLVEKATMPEECGN